MRNHGTCPLPFEYIEKRHVHCFRISSKGRHGTQLAHSSRVCAHQTTPLAPGAPKVAGEVGRAPGVATAWDCATGHRHSRGGSHSGPTTIAAHRGRAGHRPEFAPTSSPTAPIHLWGEGSSGSWCRRGQALAWGFRSRDCWRWLEAFAGGLRILDRALELCVV